MIKKMFLILVLLGSQAMMAQKIGYIEMDKILDKIPAYSSATDEIDKQVDQWQSAIDSKFKHVDDLYQNYVQTQSTLSDEQKQLKQDEIVKTENEANDYKDSIFGNDGELQKLQELKYKPIYDRVYGIAEDIAKENQFDYVFEKSAESTWVYTNPDLNLTDQIISRLGEEKK